MIEQTVHPVNPWRSEQVITCRDDDKGLRAVIAIDDTTLGPGFGGVRLAHYPDAYTALTQAQRLAATMTRKHALADLPYGGAKAVILEDGPLTRDRREQLFARFADFVLRLGGIFIPGVDMGTTPADMAVLRDNGVHAYGVDHDPYPWTARGVYQALRAGAAHAFGTDDLQGMRVAVQGVGAVGHPLARLLAADGARVLVGDIDQGRAQRLADQIGGLVIDPADAPYARCDIFAPCAVGRVLRAEAASRMQCRLVAGSANDILDDPAAAEALHERDVVVVPDYVANAGGVIHEHARAMGWDTDRLAEDVDRIGSRVTSILQEAATSGLSPSAVAERRAVARLLAAREP